MVTDSNTLKTNFEPGSGLYMYRVVGCGLCPQMY